MKKIFKPLVMGVIMALTTVAVQAADYTIRATANSNENDPKLTWEFCLTKHMESRFQCATFVASTSTHAT